MARRRDYGAVATHRRVFFLFFVRWADLGDHQPLASPALGRGVKGGYSPPVDGDRRSKTAFFFRGIELDIFFATGENDKKIPAKKTNKTVSEGGRAWFSRFVLARGAPSSRRFI